tara:strand:+ start:40 stop:198 length:159 start_codon:yes stop_codon:yes gene_type:complete
MKKYQITQSYLQIDYYEIEAENEEEAMLKLGDDAPYDTQTEDTETDIEEIKT